MVMTICAGLSSLAFLPFIDACTV